MCHARSFVFAIAVFVALTPAHAFEASCDFRECMNICRSEYEPGCTGMCARIISRCRQLVPKLERMRSARRSYNSRGDIKLDAQARGSLGHVD
jgi:hypothetical protein